MRITKSANDVRHRTEWIIKICDPTEHSGELNYKISRSDQHSISGNEVR